VTTTMRVEARHITVRGHEGYGYCKDQWREQRLIKRWKLWGVTIWRRVIGTEIVPSHVWIVWGTIGDQSGWKSRFAEYIWR
jgi:hypothetical protein